MQPQYQGVVQGVVMDGVVMEVDGVARPAVPTDMDTHLQARFAALRASTGNGNPVQPCVDQLHPVQPCVHQLHPTHDDDSDLEDFFDQS
jgi:hypothetical protein